MSQPYRKYDIYYICELLTYVGSFVIASKGVFSMQSNISVRLTGAEMEILEVLTSGGASVSYVIRELIRKSLSGSHQYSWDTTTSKIADGGSHG
jgi:hypothetical protein